MSVTAALPSGGHPELSILHHERGAATSAGAPQPPAPPAPPSPLAAVVVNSTFAAPAVAAPPEAASQAVLAAPALVPADGLAVEIATRAREGKRRFEIRLDPPELGRIDVRLDVSRDGYVTSRLIVERVDTLDLLRRDAGSLERALQEAGLRTEDGSLQFSLRDQNASAFARRDDAPRPNVLIVPDEDVAVREAVQRAYSVLRGLGGGIDIRI